MNALCSSTMGARLVLVIALVGACDDGSGFAGDYESVAFARGMGSCGGERTAEPVPGNDLFFRLADVDMLVAYFPCTAVGTCDDLHDLTRSFGAAKDGDTAWAGYLATAIPGTTCTLTYRVRRLSRDGDGHVVITTETFRDTDDTLTGSACDQQAAADRGTAMPCIEDSELVAEDR